MSVPDAAAYERKLAMTQARLAPDWQVLELGCGTGTTAIRHAPHVGHIRAVDYSAAMLDIARQRAAEAGVANVTFDQASIADLDAPEGGHDAVLALSLLHLVDDRNAVIAQAWRWLRPGGIFVTSTMCLADGLGFMRPVVPVAAAIGLFPRLHFFSADDLRASLAHAGFDIEEEWRPGKRSALFLIARRPETGPASD